jgi:hypothetical protein
MILKPRALIKAITPVVALRSEEAVCLPVDLREAKLVVEEFNKLALIDSAAVVANSEGDWSIRITATFRDLSIASKVLGTARAEEDFGTT